MLKSLKIYQVISPNGGTETFSGSSNPMNTTIDHSGSWIRCITYQVGQSSSNFAWFTGQMKFEWLQPVDLNGDRVADAFYYSFKYNGSFTNGYIDSLARSSNGGGEKTAKIFVR